MAAAADAFEQSKTIFRFLPLVLRTHPKHAELVRGERRVVDAEHSLSCGRRLPERGRRHFAERDARKNEFKREREKPKGRAPTPPEKVKEPAAEKRFFPLFFLFRSLSLSQTLSLFFPFQSWRERVVRESSGEREAGCAAQRRTGRAAPGRRVPWHAQRSSPRGR